MNKKRFLKVRKLMQARANTTLHQQKLSMPLAGMCLVALAQAASAQSIDQEANFTDTYSDFGGVGLLQMPSARFAQDGEFAFSASRTYPYARHALTFQALPALEGVIRYTTVFNRKYGAESFSGNQTYKDKSFDFKLRLIEESSSLPQVALGIRDIGGTGQFAGEYLALSRRYYNLDFTLGVGWGSLGQRGHIANPFAKVFSSFRQRQNNIGQGGTLSAQYFHGERMALFGGVAWQTPIPNLIAKLEYDANDYQHEPQNNNQKVSSPFNLGLVYRYSDWLDITLGIERGNAVMAQLSFHANPSKSAGMPKFDPPAEPLKSRAQLNNQITSSVVLTDKPNVSTIRMASEGLNPPISVETKPSVSVQVIKIQRNQALLTDLANALGSKGFRLDSLAVNNRQAVATITQDSFLNRPKAIGRAMRIMSNTLPPEVEELSYVELDKGLETQQISVLRKDLEKGVAYQSSPEEAAAHLRITPPRTELLKDDAKALPNPDRYPSYSWSWSPSMRHQIGGPDTPYLYQVYLKTSAEAQLNRNFFASAELGFNLFDNLDTLKLNSDSVLPHVRSDIKQYLQQGRTGLTRLQVDYLSNIGSSWYGRASAGLFESMFGGISGELLYRPFAKRWAVGLELNRVRQRDYDQRFRFRDYEVTTGHVDLYYRLPFYNLQTQLSVGQYLAGDRGATLTISRQFDGGTTVGVFATKTNVSAAQFGEGSFDKGFFVSIPMDMLSLYSSRDSFGMAWRPLTRDGGQRLNVSSRLYPIISDANPERLIKDWSGFLD